MYRRGTRGKPSRFSDEDIAKMRKMYLAGFKQKDIAALFGCSVGTAADFINYGPAGRPRKANSWKAGTPW